MKYASPAASVSDSAKVKELVTVLSAISLVSNRIARKLALLEKRMIAKKGKEHG